MPEHTFSEWFTGLHQFHFLRPWWLMSIPLALAAIWWLKRRGQSQGNWAKVIDTRWLPFLLDGATAPRRRHNRWWALAGLLAGLGLAGPAWQELPQPVHKEQSALVILLDLSPSMSAADLKPNRITRARHKLIDILKARDEGVTALVVYSAYGHVVSPLTDDTDTIISQVPVLEPGVMSTPGSNTEDAVDMALQLLADGGHNGGDLLIITDGITEEARNVVQQTLRGKATRLSILGVGTADGAPIPQAGGGFAKEDGAIVVAKLNREALIDLAHLNGGHYSDLTPDNRDLAYIQAAFGTPLSQNTKQLQRTFDRWNDQGHWFALLLLPLAILAFRKGLVAVLLAAPLLTPIQGHAANDTDSWGWQRLWQTPDQQGQKAFEANDFERARRSFKNHNWKGSAAYRNGDYEQALKAFSEDESAIGYYNRGNALAHLGKLDEAIAAYETALKKNPDFADAAANKKLLEQQKKQSSQNQPPQNSQSQNQQSQNQQSQNRQSQNPQSQNQSPGQQPRDSQSQNQQPGEEQRQRPPQSGDSSQPENGPQQQPQTSEPAKQQPDTDNPPEQPQAGDDLTEADKQQAAATAKASDEQADEAKRAMEQWLKKVPEDPGLFLRKKFQYQARERAMENYGHRQSKKRW